MSDRISNKISFLYKNEISRHEIFVKSYVYHPLMTVAGTMRAGLEGIRIAKKLRAAASQYGR